ncbi:hypothetical protein Dda_6370 [Drechslerella dactyloides]|uniref:Uncharacterized protein n=1 Tax=Drechslerella dactyloides TaxID=74499 RepID=A0AAD6IVE5_DREDA|nr:hypothetical protein Dda_6370 [Drechslerella dactyloides]
MSSSDSQSEKLTGATATGISGADRVSTSENASASASAPTSTQTVQDRRQIFFSGAITIEVVFTDTTDDDFFDGLFCRVFNGSNVVLLLDEIERYRGLKAGSCAFFHHGQRVTRSLRAPVGMVQLEACVLGGRCTGGLQRFLKVQDYRKGKSF